MSFEIRSDMLRLMNELAQAKQEIAVYRETCTGLNPTAYRGCVEALKRFVGDDGHYHECEDWTHKKYPDWVTVKDCIAIQLALQHAEGKEE